VTGARRLDDRRVAAARLWAATRFPYLASAVFATRILPVEARGVVAVDEQWRVHMDPELVVAWSAGQLGSVLVHHVGHLLRDHAGRARGLGLGREDRERWTLAADAEINDDLAATDLPFPVPPVLPAALGCEPGRFAEEYFRRLTPPESAECDCGSGCDGAPRGWDAAGGGLRPDTANLLRCQVASEILKACRGSQPGTVPLGLRRWAEDVLGSRVDWRRVLAAEIRRGIAAVAGAVDYSYRRPSRRASAVPDVVMPTMQRPVPEVAVVVDTSGSMNERLLGRALGEVDGLLRSLGLARGRLPVLACDTAVHAVQRVSAARQVELLGGGGTDMGQGIEAARRLRPSPSVVVVLTDGLTPWPAAPPPGLRVVVALLREGGRPPPGWARVVQVEVA
jgi:predicted metal-dependent peptidase